MTRIFYLLFALLPSLVVAQSGWTRPKNGLFLKLDGSVFSADNFYDSSGKSHKNFRFEQKNLSFYGEYGLRDRWTLIAAMPLIRINQLETTDAIVGLGDLRFEAKYALLRGAWPIALSLAPELPTGRARAFANGKTKANSGMYLPTGDGEFNLWATVAASHSYKKTYATLFAAYDFRTKYADYCFQDLYQFGGEIGWNPWRSLWLNAKLRAQFSVAESSYAKVNFLRGDATTYTLSALEIFYKFNKNWGFSATWLSGGNWISPFRNLYAAPYGSLGVVFER